MQNEFVIWHREDKHAKAYSVLLNDQSKRIARNLGLEAAHTAKECLDCHADNVPEGRRGKRFQISDGVGCEACHGGGERYLGPHQKGSHDESLKLGLYPTEQPEARARLCLSCHLGAEDKFATHRIMGAGHPRLSFELDTFTEIQPAHYKVDEDYQKRKQVYSGAQVLAVGQLMASERFLGLFTDSKFQGKGPWPELAFYDCHACHHPMDDPRWRPRAETSAAGGPGVVRINDSSFVILNNIVDKVAPESGQRLRQAVLALHKASAQDQSAIRSAAARLREVTGGLRERLLQHAFSPAELKSILRGLLAQGREGEYTDYSAAEQGVMAIASIKNALEQMQGLGESEKARLSSAMDELYRALEDPDRYKPEALESVLQSLEAVFPGG
jgi:hypothetical protein